MAGDGGGEGEEGVGMRGLSKEDSAGFNKHFSVDQNHQAYRVCSRRDKNRLQTNAGEGAKDRRPKK